jgi:sugar lactone lactonase YvrE
LISASLLEQSPPKYNNYSQQGITVAGGNGKGNQLNQLGSPGNIIIDENKTILISDETNHRIVEWKYKSNNSQIIVGGNNQLSNPTDVVVDKKNNALIIFEAGKTRAIRWFRENQSHEQILTFGFSVIRLTMDKNGSLYISDYYEHDVRRWKDGDTTHGTIVAGGNNRGDDPNQLNAPGCIFVDDNYSVYVSDVANFRVMKWKKNAPEGIVVAGGNGYGNNLDQLSSPEGVIVDHMGDVYVADWTNHRIMRWREGDIYGSIVVGGNIEGSESNQLNAPTRLAFDDEENLYVVDQNNRRVQKFEISSE